MKRKSTMSALLSATHRGEYLSFIFTVWFFLLIGWQSGVMSPELRRIFSGQYGVFECLSVVFLLLVLGGSARQAWHNKEHKSVSFYISLSIALGAFVMLGEEFRWGVPFFYESDLGQPLIRSLQDVFALSIEGLPAVHDTALLHYMIGVVRAGFAVAALVLMAVLLRVDLRQNAVLVFMRQGERFVFYALCFVVFTVIAILLDARIIPHGFVLEEAMELGVAIALFMAGFSADLKVR